MVSATKAPEVAKKLHDTWPLFAKLQMHYYTAECEFRYAQSLHPIPEEGCVCVQRTSVTAYSHSPSSMSLIFLRACSFHTYFRSVWLLVLLAVPA